jgi:chemotaxis family two-component system response regulator Rcp1
VSVEHFGKPIETLLVEDNPRDVRLTRKGLVESKVRNNLSVVEDGVKAMAFLVVKVRMPMHPVLTSSCSI